MDKYKQTREDYSTFISRIAHQNNDNNQQQQQQQIPTLSSREQSYFPSQRINQQATARSLPPRSPPTPVLHSNINNTGNSTADLFFPTPTTAPTNPTDVIGVVTSSSAVGKTSSSSGDNNNNKIPPATLETSSLSRSSSPATNAVTTTTTNINAKITNDSSGINGGSSSSSSVRNSITKNQYINSEMEFLRSLNNSNNNSNTNQRIIGASAVQVASSEPSNNNKSNSPPGLRLVSSATTTTTMSSYNNSNQSHQLPLLPSDPMPPPLIPIHPTLNNITTSQQQQQDANEINSTSTSTSPTPRTFVSSTPFPLSQLHELSQNSQNQSYHHNTSTSSSTVNPQFLLPQPHAAGNKMWNALQHLKQTPPVRFGPEKEDNDDEEIMMSPGFSPQSFKQNKRRPPHLPTSSNYSNSRNNTNNTNMNLSGNSRTSSPPPLSTFFGDNDNINNSKFSSPTHRAALQANIDRSYDAQQKKFHEQERQLDEMQRLNIIEQRLTDHQNQHTKLRAQRLLDADRARWEVQRCDFRTLEVQAQLEAACTALQERLLSRIATIKQLQEDSLRKTENRLQAEVRGEHDRHIAHFRDQMAERTATIESLSVALQQLAAHVEVQFAQTEHEISKRALSVSMDKLVQMKATLTAEIQQQQRGGGSSGSADSMVTMVQNFGSDIKKQLSEMRNERITFHQRMAKRVEDMRGAKLASEANRHNQQQGSAFGSRRGPSL